MRTFTATLICLTLLAVGCDENSGGALDTVDLADATGELADDVADAPADGDAFEYLSGASISKFTSLHPPHLTQSIVSMASDSEGEGWVLYDVDSRSLAQGVSLETVWRHTQEPIDFDEGPIAVPRKGPMPMMVFSIHSTEGCGTEPDPTTTGLYSCGRVYVVLLDRFGERTHTVEVFYGPD